MSFPPTCASACRQPFPSPILSFTSHHHKQCQTKKQHRAPANKTHPGARARDRLPARPRSHQAAAAASNGNRSPPMPTTTMSTTGATSLGATARGRDTMVLAPPEALGRDRIIIATTIARTEIGTTETETATGTVTGTDAIGATARAAARRDATVEIAGTATATTIGGEAIAPHGTETIETETETPTRPRRKRKRRQQRRRHLRSRPTEKK